MQSSLDAGEDERAASLLIIASEIGRSRSLLTQRAESTVTILLGLQAFVTHHDGEFHALTFHENAVALAAMRGSAQYVVTAIPGNKAESLRCVEPLHGARFASGCRQGLAFWCAGFTFVGRSWGVARWSRTAIRGEQDAGQGSRLACDLRQGGEQDGCLQGAMATSRSADVAMMTGGFGCRPVWQKERTGRSAGRASAGTRLRAAGERHSAA